MTDFIIWYLMLAFLGWLSTPLAFRLFPSLADRGYAFSRCLGLLLWGYVFWLLASLGLLRNDRGGLLFALGIVGLMSAWAASRGRLVEIIQWIRQNKSYVWFVEILFLVAIAGWTVVRAANPEVLGTEKPMELAFINAILHSPLFPPHDPWLSGFAISYYYFGYVMVAMLAKLGEVPGGVAFNLGVAMVFGISAISAYGMVYNLLARQIGKNDRLLGLPLLGPLFVSLAGNLEGFLEILHARGLFWSKLTSGEWISPFWKWLDLVELSLPPAQPLSWAPSRYLWWWRASRVLQDYDIAGNVKEVIDEFPAFSYLLADLHPHVLAMPFAFLAMALALQVYRSSRGTLNGPWRLGIQIRWLAWIGSLALAFGIALAFVGMLGRDVMDGLYGLVIILAGCAVLISLLPSIHLYGAGIFFVPDSGQKVISIPIFGDPAITLFCALMLGGLAFLNTWDFPFYVALTAAAYALGKWELLRASVQEASVTDPVGEPRFSGAVKDFFWAGIILGIAGVLLYLPFYMGFSSQAGGVIPNLIYPTRGVHLWIMFAPLLIPILLYFYFIWRQERPTLIRGLQIAMAVMLTLWFISFAFGWVILILPGIGDIFLGSLGAPDSSTVFNTAITRRLSNIGGWLTLLILLGLTLAFLLAITRQKNRTEMQETSPDRTFVLLLILLGVLLVLGPEFFFLRDQFGWRINTIFKFYYQAWLLWGVAAAYTTCLLLLRWRSSWGWVSRGGMFLLLCASLSYIVLGLNTKTQGFDPSEGWTLDGSAHLKRGKPDEMAAIDWLTNAPPGVVAEAVSPTGGSYTEYARVAVLSGHPGVLGWIGHESQWRGGDKEMGTRRTDLERLYCTRQWIEAQQILQRYQIRYVFIGSLERVTYVPGQGSCQTGMSEIKFSQYMETVFQQGDVRIYALP